MINNPITAQSNFELNANIFGAIINKEFFNSNIALIFGP